jgi:hypothetical protein
VAIRWERTGVSPLEDQPQSLTCNGKNSWALVFLRTGLPREEIFAQLAESRARSGIEPPGRGAVSDGWADFFRAVDYKTRNAAEYLVSEVETG